MSRVLLWAAAPALLFLGACGAKAESPMAAEAGFADRLTDMVFGRKPAIALKLGYPLAQTAIVHWADQPNPADAALDLYPFHQVFRFVDAAYADPTTAAPTGRLKAYVFAGVPTARRVQSVRETGFETVRRDNARQPIERRSAALAILTHSAQGAEKVAALARELTGSASPAYRPVPGCALYMRTDSAGYVDGAVATLALPPSGVPDLREAGARQCLMAAQIFNIGFSDAVASRRIGSLPSVAAQMDDCAMRAGASMPAPTRACYSSITGRALYALAAQLVRSGKLRPGSLSRNDFRRLALTQVREIGAETLKFYDKVDRETPRSAQAFNRNPPRPTDR